jgi:hypothetical protein
MRHAALIMHDETERAEELLADGSSPFHKVRSSFSSYKEGHYHGSHD